MQAEAAQVFDQLLDAPDGSMPAAGPSRKAAGIGLPNELADRLASAADARDISVERLMEDLLNAAA